MTPRGKTGKKTGSISGRVSTDFGVPLGGVEVKARSRASDAALSLDHYRLRRVAAAAEALAPRFARPGDDLRIDAVFVTRGRLPRHVPNVWHG